MKLEVGMYVKTKVGKIAKIINKYDNSGSLHKTNFVWVLDDCSVLALHSQKVVKASHNIIDLIEVGDYINGYKVVDIIHNNRKLEPSTMVYCEYGNNYIGFYNEEIKSVITHEQMEQMEYKVEE